MEREVYERMAALESDHWWFAARREILGALLQRAALPPGAAILEAGCGTGGNLPLLQRHGHVHAFEPDPTARAFVSDRHTVPVADGALPHRIPFAESQFDLVAALDVIEHVDAPEESVAALVRRLRPGGRVLLTVPAYAFLWSRHDERHHHKRRYTRGEVIQLLEAAGAQVEVASYFNTLLFPAIAGVRLAKALTRADTEDDQMPSAPVNRLLRELFSAERRLVGRIPLPFGVSIVALARARGAAH